LSPALNLPPKNQQLTNPDKARFAGLSFFVLCSLFFVLSCFCFATKTTELSMNLSNQIIQPLDPLPAGRSNLKSSKTNADNCSDKRCTKCQELLPLTNFYPLGRGRLSSWCKACTRAQAKTTHKKQRTAQDGQTQFCPECARLAAALKACMTRCAEVIDERDAALGRHQPSVDQLVALRLFAQRHGANWKQTLTSMWRDGTDTDQPNGHLLRQINHDFGPAWLRTV
jgi:hypothetical protein